MGTTNLADVDPTVSQCHVISRREGKLYSTEVTGLMKSVFEIKEASKGLHYKVAKADEAGPSQQGVNIGRRVHPFNMLSIADFQNLNVHHARCLQTCVDSAVGLGFYKEGEGDSDPLSTDPAQKPKRKTFEPTKADLALNPLCIDQTFQDILTVVAEDYFQVGNGYIEVVRDGPGGAIVGLHHIPAQDVFVYIEDYYGRFHYEVMNNEAGGIKTFARWGDSARILNAPLALGTIQSSDNQNYVSEVIRFRNPSSRSKWYGFPKWLAAVASIELVGMLHQYMYDYFLNRGVPEFMLFVSGAQLAPKDWAVIENAIKANIGMGNSHKTVALNIPGTETKIQVERLAMESSNEGTDFAAKKDNLALDIISAHGVPPLLAGIQTPGKLGATNELPNALMSFQVTRIGQVQRMFQQMLGMTLGDKATNGGLDLEPKDFAFRTITEEIDIGAMDTVSRMRQTVPEAKAQGRDLNAGLKD